MKNNKWFKLFKDYLPTILTGGLAAYFGFLGWTGTTLVLLLVCILFLIDVHMENIKDKK